MPTFETDKTLPTPQPTDAQKQLARLKAQKLAAADSNALAVVPNHICLCIDTSISMSNAMDDRDYRPTPEATRLGVARSAVRGLVASSDPKTTAYSLVIFDNYGKLLVEKTTSYMALQTAPYDVGGSTNMADGLRHALSQKPTRIILLSDGQPNHPPYTEIAMAAEAKIKIDTIAIGGADDALMRRIASETGGVFKRATTAQDLTDHFLQLEPAAYLQLEHKDA